jgi:hypothetical protein
MTVMTRKELADIVELTRKELVLPPYTRYLGGTKYLVAISKKA